MAEDQYLIIIWDYHWWNDSNDELDSEVQNSP